MASVARVEMPCRQRIAKEQQFLALSFPSGTVVPNEHSRVRWGAHEQLQGHGRRACGPTSHRLMLDFGELCHILCLLVSHVCSRYRMIHHGI